jgi:hypothetical protein
MDSSDDINHGVVSKYYIEKIIGILFVDYGWIKNKIQIYLQKHICLTCESFFFTLKMKIWIVM